MSTIEAGRGKDRRETEDTGKKCTLVERINVEHDMPKTQS